MKYEKALATVLAVTGLSLMYHAAGQPPEKVSIGEINERMVGEKVTVYGEVRNLSASEDALFFTLKNSTEKIRATSFRENLLVTNKSRVQAQGKVSLYQGEVQLIVNRIN